MEIKVPAGMTERKEALVIDYGVGNHQSVLNALWMLGYKAEVSRSREDIVNSDAYILPGVGAFPEAMKNLHAMGIIDLLRDEVLVRGKPLLGICLGMQILAESSEENGYHEGLGLIKGRVIKFEQKRGFRIPHVGWNDVRVIKKEPLFTKTREGSNFYFDHSYHFICGDGDVSAIGWHGIDFVAAVQRNNIFGLQFHPEKSHNNGLKVLRAFFNYLSEIKDKARCLKTESLRV